MRGRRRNLPKAISPRRAERLVLLFAEIFIPFPKCREGDFYFQEKGGEKE